MSSRTIFQYSGLNMLNPGKNFLETKNIEALEKGFPSDHIVGPLYIKAENFQQIPKPKRFAVFYVMRDPRDLAVSHYFSQRYSHPLLIIRMRLGVGG